MSHPETERSLTRPRLPRAVQVLWLLGFLIGTSTHVVDLVSGGTATYAGYPTAVRAFWVSLTLIDPLVVVLILLRRRAGIVLAVAVLLVDVAVNWTVFATIGPRQLSGVVRLTLFTVLVLATAPVLWRWFGRSR